MIPARWSAAINRLIAVINSPVDAMNSGETVMLSLFLISIFIVTSPLK